MPPSSPFTVVWDTEQRERLHEIVRSRTEPLRRVQRAMVALDAADGATNTEIAYRRCLHVDTVRRWRRRFHAEGLTGLDDRPRTGRPRRYGPDTHLAIIATVTSSRPATGSHWTHRQIANHPSRHGISASQTGRILAGLDLKPHLVRGWLTRPGDPDFATKATDVCDIYLHPPPGSVVFSVDEKTAVQSRSRQTPGRNTLDTLTGGNS